MEGTATDTVAGVVRRPAGNAMGRMPPDAMVKVKLAPLDWTLNDWAAGAVLDIDVNSNCDGLTRIDGPAGGTGTGGGGPGNGGTMAGVT